MTEAGFETGQVQHSSRGHRQWARPTYMAAAILLSVGILASCGSDDSSDPEAAFCDAADQLRSDIDGLADIDIIADGTSAVEAQFSAISNDVDELRSSASDVAADELDTLDTAVDQLGTALDALGDDVSVAGAADAVAAAVEVDSAARAVIDQLSTACPG